MRLWVNDTGRKDTHSSIENACGVADAILARFEAPNHLYRSTTRRASYYCKDWSTSIMHINPAVLDLGCGAGRTTRGEVARVWLPAAPLLLGTHGADPRRIIGVDLYDFPEAKGIYTHIKQDLIEVARNGTLQQLLGDLVPEDGFHAVVINNAEIWADDGIVSSLIKQALPLLREDGLTIEDDIIFTSDRRRIGRV